jgi:DnaA N-terminal domain
MVDMKDHLNVSIAPMGIPLQKTRSGPTIESLRSNLEAAKAAATAPPPTRQQAIDTALCLVDNWDRKMSGNFLDSIAEVLTHFPRPIGRECAHPWHGIARTKTSKGEVREWPPSASEVVAWCEQLFAHCVQTAQSPTIRAAPDPRWQPIFDRLKAALGEAAAVSWFADAQLHEIVDGCATVTMQTRFKRHWVEIHFDQRVLQAIAAEHPEVTMVIFRAASELTATKARRELPGAPDRSPAIAAAAGGG